LGSFTKGRDVQNFGTTVTQGRNIGGSQLPGSLSREIQTRFLSKFGTVLEEADESAFWVELLVEARKVPAEKARALLKEANELTAIAISSINTARKN
jgi:hypothetical protein